MSSYFADFETSVEELIMNEVNWNCNVLDTVSNCLGFQNINVGLDVFLNGRRAMFHANKHGGVLRAQSLCYTAKNIMCL